MSDSPQNKPTLQLPKADIQEQLLKSLERAVTSGFTDLRTRLDNQDVQLEVAVKEGQRTNSRLTLLESRVEDLEIRITRASTRVQQSSEQELEQAAQLAQEKVAREQLAKRVDELSKSNEVQLAILSRLDSLFKNPAIKLIAFAIWTGITGWLANRGLSVTLPK